MKNRIVLAIITIITIIAFNCDLKVAVSADVIDLFNKNITDERLVEMVENGDIPNNVDFLYLSKNRITDITPLTQLKWLSTLFLAENQIINLSPLSSFEYLMVLILNDNRVKNLTPLSQLKNLEFLLLDNNLINNFNALKENTALIILGLGNNQINDISPISLLIKLKFLALNDNQISDLSPLYNLKNLQILTLNNNPINEFHIIELKSHLPNCIIEYTPTPGHVLGNIDVTIFDGIEILKYLVGIESVIDDSKVALEAAMMTAESKARGEPTIFDFVEILLILVDM